MTDRVMLDLETLGLEPGSAILSIGAARFTHEGVGETFHMRVSLESCQQAGLSIDAETLQWWLDQDEAAMQSAFRGTYSLAYALDNFTEWYGDADEVWANPIAFDCLHLEHAYNAIDQEAPWAFYERRDLMTLEQLGLTPDIEHEGTEHDALDDAIHQAEVAAGFLAAQRDPFQAPGEVDA